MKGTCKGSKEGNIEKAAFGEGNGNPLQYSCPGNPVDRGAWRAIVHGVTKESDTTEVTKQQHMTLENMFHLQFLLQMKLSTSQSCSKN